MSVLDFGVEVIAISASGVLAPGPLFFTNLLYGTRQGMRSGIKVAYGHTVVELPLIILLAAGLFTSAAISQYAGAIGLIGGIGILGFASLQIAGVVARRKDVQAAPVMASGKSPFVAGIALSALNPFFLVWWFTVGLKLIADSAAFGLAAGIMILFALHIWMDYAWLAGTAYLASKGSSVIKSKYYPLLLIALAAVLLYYGTTFVLSSLFADM
ncbi:L-lysine exporter family protein [Candidatus Nitrososphaera gargensis Ga9.2]|uniref:L-lysine exporter family protein n=1 Tax=Nitrososphaera gargensis (strain Ga9.2) TaxID=1237085 RepID=K0IKC8_NITGG|nr:LysE family transporter [Candidatus Nitrososphaera gargensis]AFU58832.1 L-lysine exporter family protein [Candidatus Nitrososphaera gargensis Ga9.2]